MDSATHHPAGVLHDPPELDTGAERIACKPTDSASQQADDAEFDECGRYPAAQQQRHADQYHRMDDVHGIGAAVEPCPKGGGLVHVLAEDQQPCGDEAPGYERFPEGIKDCSPGVPSAEVGFSQADQGAGYQDTYRQTGPRNQQSNHPRPGVLPPKLPQPFVAPGGDAYSEEKDVTGKVG